jgi:hypothetical protein
MPNKSIFRDVEEQAYAICRWLRAVKFDSQALLAFLKAKANHLPSFEAISIHY